MGGHDEQARDGIDVAILATLDSFAVTFKNLLTSRSVGPEPRRHGRKIVSVCHRRNGTGSARRLTALLQTEAKDGNQHCERDGIKAEVHKQQAAYRAGDISSKERNVHRKVWAQPQQL